MTGLEAEAGFEVGADLGPVGFGQVAEHVELA